MLGHQTHCPFEALAGDTGAGDAAKDGGFWRAHVVPVEAGDGEGLEDVEFDEFHWVGGWVDLGWEIG
ncbi:MAG: hypothetical protein Fur0032_20170 [Terrimicrobiaceae bacterium]